jgi:nitrogen-specific signal transduction histidine kinase
MLISLEEQDFDRVILDAIPHWAMLIDGSTRTILAMNKKAEELGSVLQGQCWDDFAHRTSLSKEHVHLINKCPNRKRDSEIKCDFCQADEALTKKEKIVSEVDINGKIWRTFWVPVKGNIYLHYAIDITEEKNIEKFKLYAKELETVIQTSGAVCHEVNQPLQIITGAASINNELLKDPVKNKDKIVELLKKISAQVDRITSITRKLSKINKVIKKQYLNSKILDIEKSSQ